MRPHVFVKVITIFAYQCFQSIDDWKGFFFLCDLLSALLAKVSDLDWNEMFSNKNEWKLLFASSKLRRDFGGFFSAFVSRSTWVLLLNSFGEILRAIASTFISLTDS